MLARDFPAANLNAAAVLFRLPSSVWSHPAMLATAQRDLLASGRFHSVIGVLQDTRLTPTQLLQLRRRLGPADLLPAGAASGTRVPAAAYNAYRASAQFISADGRTVQFSAILDNSSASSPSAIAAIPLVRSAVARVGGRIGASSSGLFGLQAFAYDVEHISNSDLGRIIPVVAVLIACLLAVVMRSLVAPVFLVVSVLVSYLAALGLTSVIFVHLAGDSGINFILPFLMFVFLMALGSDYNILIMTRIREEARTLPLTEAVRRAVAATGTTVGTAGLILGGTFAVLGLAGGGGSGGSQIQQIGLGIAAGVFMDTFVIRPLVVPAVVVLLDRWTWWPSRLSRPPTGGSRGQGAVAAEEGAA